MPPDDRRRQVPYDRAVLVHTLIYHQRANSSSCICGWSELGRLHSAHIADEYEALALGRPE